MRWGRWCVGLAVALLRAQTPAAQATPTGYVSPSVCAGCHAAIARSYQRTWMGRSFYRPSPRNQVEDYTSRNTYYHRASDTYYQMTVRGGRYFQLQYQLGFEGRRTNELEKEVDFIIGSGNHSRTYLHRTSRNTLVELPLAWYAENGGYWAMNP